VTRPIRWPAIALLIAGCLAVPPAGGPTRPATVITVGSVDVTVTDCDDAPATFGVLCQVHDLIRVVPLVPVDDAALARGAVMLLRERADGVTSKPGGAQ
jgi:hypothetical protein